MHASGPPAMIVGDTELTVRHQAPGKDSGRRAFHDMFRPGADTWVVVVGDVEEFGDEPGALGDLVMSKVRTAMTGGVSPSAAVMELNGLLSDLGRHGVSGRLCNVVVARVELDLSGASVTFAGVGRTRPIVRRRAGWVDVRSPGPVPGGGSEAPADDRVALGPGDSFVLCSEAPTVSRNGAGAVFGETVLPDVLLDAAESSADALADRIVAAAEEFGEGMQQEAVVLVLRVPETARYEGPEAVARSTGTEVDRLPLAGYSVRDVHAGETGHAVMPPREVLARLAPEPPSIPALRRLLRRVLESWGIDRVAEDDIELLATEMATNAFSRTASPVTVVVRYTGPVVRVEVGDGEREQPRKRRLEFDDLRGHRLALVESLASDWGMSTTPRGKRIWFEVVTPNRN